MIIETSDWTDLSTASPTEQVRTVVVRYGRVPRVARFTAMSVDCARDALVVVATDRGEELAVVLAAETLRSTGNSLESATGSVLRVATGDDSQLASVLQKEADDQFERWQQLVADRKLQLQIIDLEYTLDRKLIVYTLNERGPETTRLSLLAAAAGLGLIHVEPVSAKDSVEAPPKKTGGCGSGSCGCSTKRS